MANLSEAVQKFASDLAERVENFVQDMSVLEVRTYTTPEDQVKVFVSDRPDMTTIANEGNVALRAFTQVSLDGDTAICVPEQADGTVDKGVWDIHTQTVEQAMANRVKLMASMGEAASAALNALQQAREG
jgi:hypothetical protein